MKDTLLARRLMLTYLIEKGWTPTFNELENIIDELNLNDNFVEWLKYKGKC